MPEHDRQLVSALRAHATTTVDQKTIRRGTGCELAFHTAWQHAFAFVGGRASQMLMNFGCRNITEAQDGLAAVEAVRALGPDVLLLDWKLPIFCGEEVIRIIRSPGVFPCPGLPIVVLTDQAEKTTVLAALRAGAHEFLARPTSPASLYDKIISVVAKPRPMVKLGKFYVPEPRRSRDGTDPLEIEPQRR